MLQPSYHLWIRIIALLLRKLRLFQSFSPVSQNPDNFYCWNLHKKSTNFLQTCDHQVLLNNDSMIQTSYHSYSMKTEISQINRWVRFRPLLYWIFKQTSHEDQITTINTVMEGKWSSSVKMQAKQAVAGFSLGFRQQGRTYKNLSPHLQWGTNGGGHIQGGQQGGHIIQGGQLIRHQQFFSALGQPLGTR